MKKTSSYIAIFLLLFIGIYLAFTFMFYGTHPYRQWDMQAIDTMKYSRDLARVKANDASFDKEIDDQMKNIAATGATHVAISTPYDEEFLPFMKRWVASARKYKLNVWFRGNFSGWEEWFEYKKIDKQTHIAKTKSFIESHQELFEDGDIFTSCTECENGTKMQYGDPHDVALHRAFLIEEYTVTKAAFAKINKNVKSNYYSMNGDVALAMMDKETTQAFDGIVVVDHYVKDPKQMAHDLRALAAQSGGTIILGEVGAPVPNIHGAMTTEEQTLWVSEALHEAARIPQVGGVNYWVNKDGTTAIWEKDNKPKPSVEVITKYFKGKMHVIKFSN
jgi:hypothetical protein